MKQKILYVITKSNWGGAQRYVFDLATSLPSDTYEVAVAMGGTGNKDTEAGLLEQKLRERNIRTIFISSFMRDVSPTLDLSALAELTKLFEFEKPDVVHLNSSKAGGLGALAARRAGIKKIVFTSHGLPYDEERNLFSRGLIWLATWATFLLCHVVIVISHNNQNRARRFPWCAKKIHLIHNGVGGANFAKRDEARAALSTTMSPLPQSPLWIGTIANLEWNKGLHYLVRAAADLKRKGVDFTMCIIGEGEERVFLETLITDEDVAEQVFLVGFVENAAQYLRAFDIFTLTSVKEGLPYVVMEAGLAECATVATSVGGVSDIIDDAVSGVLVHPKNHSELAIALGNLLDNEALRQEYGHTLREHIETEFSLTHMIEETTQLYETSS